jgi:integrase/recombinase XerD
MKTQLAGYSARAEQFQSVNIKTFLWLRKSKVNAQGTAPIMLRIFTSVHERFERSTGLRITFDQWDAPNGRILGKGKVIQMQNERLKLMEAQIYELINLMKAMGKKVTLASLKRELAAPEVGRPVCFIDLCQRMAETHRTAGNFNYYESAVAAIGSLKQWNGIDKDGVHKALPLEEFTPRRAAEFYTWLQVGPRKLKIASANHSTAKLSALFRLAAEYEEADIADNPFRALRKKKADTPPPRLHLTREQFATLRDADLSKREGWARDIYLAQYYLHGSRIGVVLLLRWGQVTQTQVHFKAEKGGPHKVVAISPDLARVLARYRPDNPSPEAFVFPHLPASFDSLPAEQQHARRASATNGINIYLKRVAALIGLEGRLHTHTARHTLAGHAAELGGLDVAQGMLGHATAAMTAHYAGPLHNEGLARVERALYGGGAEPAPAPEPTPPPSEGGKVLPLWKGGEAA